MSSDFKAYGENTGPAMQLLLVKSIMACEMRGSGIRKNVLCAPSTLHFESWVSTELFMTPSLLRL